jgi:hypothetical protein
VSRPEAACYNPRNHSSPRLHIPILRRADNPVKWFRAHTSADSVNRSTLTSLPNTLLRESAIALEIELTVRSGRVSPSQSGKP